MPGTSLYPYLDKISRQRGSSIYLFNNPIGHIISHRGSPIWAQWSTYSCLMVHHLLQQDSVRDLLISVRIKTLFSNCRPQLRHKAGDQGSQKVITSLILTTTQGRMPFLTLPPQAVRRPWPSSQTQSTSARSIARPRLQRTLTLCLLINPWLTSTRTH